MCSRVCARLYLMAECEALSERVARWLLLIYYAVLLINKLLLCVYVLLTQKHKITCEAGERGGRV